MAEAQVESIKERLATDIKKTKSGAVVTAVGGVILSIVVGAILSSLGKELVFNMQPKTVLQTVSGTIMAQVPPDQLIGYVKELTGDLEGRVKDIAGQAKGHAPKYVKQAFGEVSGEIPKLRKQAEARVSVVIDNLLETIRGDFKELMGSFIDNVKEEDVKNLLQIAAKDPERLEAMLTEWLENDIAVLFDARMDEEFYPAMKEVEDELDALQGSNLTAQQHAKREWIVAVMILIDDIAQGQLDLGASHSH